MSPLSLMMMIRFVAHGASSHLGGFAPGDLARVDDEHGRHLIDVARVAVAVEPPPASAPAPKRSTKRR